MLRGEEFNSVNEAAPRLMKALADGINVPMGALRKMAEEGKLTSAVLSEALPKALGQLREESKEVQTIGGAFTVLKNNIMEMVGAQSNASGTTKAFASGINALANNLDLLAATGGAVAVVLGARFAASITASGVAFAASAVQAARYQAALASMAGVSTTAAAGLVTVGAAARGASAAMSLLGGPVGAVPTAVGLAATAFYTFGDSTSALAKSIGGLDQPLEDLKRKIDALPPEKRISIIMEIKDDAVKQAKTVEASFVERGNSVMGAFTGMGAVTGATMKELQGLNDRLRDAQRTGADMTPILQEAAKSAGVSQATLKSWLDLASNIRAARNAANDSQNLAASATAGIAGRETSHRQGLWRQRGRASGGRPAKAAGDQRSPKRHHQTVHRGDGRLRRRPAHRRDARGGVRRGSALRARCEGRPHAAITWVVDVANSTMKSRQQTDFNDARNEMLQLQSQAGCRSLPATEH